MKRTIYTIDWDALTIEEFYYLGALNPQVEVFIDGDSRKVIIREAQGAEE